MAVQHCQFNEVSQHGRLLRQWLAALEDVLTTGGDILALGPQMIDGDGSADAHFDYFAARFGFDSSAKAKAAVNLAHRARRNNPCRKFVNSQVKAF